MLAVKTVGFSLMKDGEFKLNVGENVVVAEEDVKSVCVVGTPGVL